MEEKTSGLPYEISPHYRRVNQRNLLFARLEWDESLKGLYDGIGASPRRLVRMGNGESGYGLPGYALWSAGRYLDGFNDRLSATTGGDLDLYSSMSRSVPGWSLADESWDDNPLLEAARREMKERARPEELTRMVKRAARFLGADLVGIAPYDERWVYSHLYRRRDPSDEGRWVYSRRSRPGDFPADEKGQEMVLEMPKARSVVVLAFEEDYEALNTSPAAIGMAATGLGYSRMSFTTSSLAEFIRAPGYWARACGNDLALSVPLAVAAGLGELGRHGQLITREYGPRIRLSKVFTDMDLVPDGPRLFGVWEFCKVCKKCAEHCPPRAIPFDDEPSWEGPTLSNNPGVLKWYVNPEKCSRYLKWNGGDCTNCHSRCPYNKDYGRWYHRLARDLAPKLGSKLSSFALWLDDLLGYGKQTPSADWWESESY